MLDVSLTPRLLLAFVSLDPFSGQPFAHQDVAHGRAIYGYGSQGPTVSVEAIALDVHLGNLEQLHQPGSGAESADVLLAALAPEFRRIDAFDTDFLTLHDDRVTVDDDNLLRGAGYGEADDSGYDGIILLP